MRGARTGLPRPSRSSAKPRPGPSCPAEHHKGSAAPVIQAPNASAAGRSASAAAFVRRRALLDLLDVVPLHHLAPARDFGAHVGGEALRGAALGPRAEVAQPRLHDRVRQRFPE